MFTQRIAFTVVKIKITQLFVFTTRNLLFEYLLLFDVIAVRSENQH